MVSWNPPRPRARVHWEMEPLAFTDLLNSMRLIHPISFFFFLMSQGPRSPRPCRWTAGGGREPGSRSELSMCYLCSRIPFVFFFFPFPLFSPRRPQSPFTGQPPDTHFKHRSASTQQLDRSPGSGTGLEPFLAMRGGTDLELEVEAQSTLKSPNAPACECRGCHRGVWSLCPFCAYLQVHADGRKYVALGRRTGRPSRPNVDLGINLAEEASVRQQPLLFFPPFENLPCHGMLFFSGCSMLLLPHRTLTQPPALPTLSSFLRFVQQGRV